MDYDSISSLIDSINLTEIYNELTSVAFTAISFRAHKIINIQTSLQGVENVLNGIKLDKINENNQPGLNYRITALMGSISTYKSYLITLSKRCIFCIF